MVWNIKKCFILKVTIVCALVAYCHAGLLAGPAYSSAELHAPAYAGYAGAAYAPVAYAAPAYAPVLKSYAAPIVKAAPVDYYVSLKNNQNHF